MADVISLDFPQADVAVLTINDPAKGANVLSRHVLAELTQHLDALEKRTDLAGVIVYSTKPKSFIAGADLREFAASMDVPKDAVIEICRNGQELLRRFALFNCVTVAAIDGMCLGGGAELASWCDRRILANNDQTKFGFPEVKIGLMPGWGGTVRMSRMAGLGNAVELITSGEPIDARTAYAMNIACDFVASEDLLEAAIRCVRAEAESKQFLADRKLWAQPLQINETELGFLGVTASGYIQQQTGGQYPAPLAALETLLAGASLDESAALQLEATSMANLFGSPVNRALINVFFLTDRNKKDTGIASKGITPGQIKSVGVIGAGIMGAGIAAATLKRRLPVALADANSEALARGATHVLEEASFDRQTKGPDVAKALQLAPLLVASGEGAELASRDLVIEAIIENLEAKQTLYARIEPQLKPDALLASNTSTIPITKLAAKLKRPEQFCGIHFFNPVRRMPLVEIIRGEKTSDQTIATAVAYAKSIGKSPIVVNDGPGFLVNRLLFPYMNEAIALLCEGVQLNDIERAAKAFGMPMGPFTLYDVVGIDTSVYAGRVLAESFPERFPPSPLLPTMLKRGRLGQKSGAGFFKYRGKGGKGEPDPTLADVIAPYITAGPQLSAQQITERLFLPMLLEATRVLEAGLVRDPRDVDLGLIFGIGFPPAKGGLLFWADQLGADKILKMLEPYQSVGPRYAPTPLLEQLAKTGGKFYPKQATN